MRGQEIPELLTIEEVSRILKLSKNAVYVLVHRKQIPTIKIGRRVRFSASEINQWIQEHTVDQAKCRA